MLSFPHQKFRILQSQTYEQKRIWLSQSGNCLLSSYSRIQCEREMELPPLLAEISRSESGQRQKSHAGVIVSLCAVLIDL